MMDIKRTSYQDHPYLLAALAYGWVLPQERVLVRVIYQIAVPGSVLNLLFVHVLVEGIMVFSFSF